MTHRIGEHWTDGHQAYVNIPRNASTTITAVLAENGWHKRHDPTDLPAVAVVRDPYDRYWSGVREYERRHNRQADRSVVRVWDEHTLPQHVFLMPFEGYGLVPLERLDVLGAWLGLDFSRRLNESVEQPNPYPRAQVEAFYDEDVRMYEQTVARS